MGFFRINQSQNRSLIRRSRTTGPEEERGVKSYESRFKEGEWNPLRKNLIERKSLIKKVSVTEKDEMHKKKKCLRRK